MAAFVPYLIIGAIGLIGEWLIGPDKSRQNPNQMPQLNQSLRGSTIYVTFGTNRVNAQIVWTKNWKATKATAGKKGGGSGGMGAAKGGSGSGYTYTWDAMFNYGFVDQPSFIGRAWIGQDPVKKENIVTLDAGITGANLTLINTAYTSTSSNVATLKYTEAHVAPGYPTNDANQSTWSYFQTQENLSCQWPSTFWIGFRALNLGNSGQLPQLAVELVPTNFGFAPNTGFIGISGNNAKSNPASTGAWLDDGTGQLYVCDFIAVGGTSNRAIIYTIQGVQKSTLSDAQWKTDVGALGLNTTGLAYATTVAIPGSKYFYVLGTATHAVNQSNLVGVLYSVNTDGTITRQGGFQRLYGVLAGGLLGDSVFAAQQGTDGLVYVAYQASADGTVAGGSGGFTAWATCWPNPTSLLGSTTDINTNVGQGTGTQVYGPVNGDMINFFNQNQSNRSEDFCLAGLVQGPTGEMYLCSYVSKARMDYAAANTGTACAFIVANQPTYPNGCMMMSTITGGLITVTTTTMAVNNSFFKDTSGANVFPASDVGLTSTGAAGTAYDDYYTPQGSVDGQYAVAVRMYSDDHRKLKVLVFQDTGTACNEVSSITGEYDTSANDGEGSSLPTPSVVYPFFYQGNVYVAVNFVGGSFNPGQINATFANVGAGTLDVTPPYVIKRILTSKVWGFQTDALFGFNPTDLTIDATSYADAVQYCVDNGIFISVTYTNSDSLLNIINELVALYNGYIVEHGGTIYFGVVRDTDVQAPFRTIDNKHLISPGPGKPPVDITKGAIQDGYNIIEFQYLDRNLEYNQNTVWVSDEVDIDFNGPRQKTYSAKFVMSGSTAYQCAERALWSNLYGKDNYSFKLGVQDADLRPGRVITLVDSFDATLSGGVQALITNWSEPKRFEFEVKAVRVFADHLTSNHAYTATASVDTGVGKVVTPVAPPLAMRAYELPKRFQGTSPSVYFGWNQGCAVMGGQLWLSLDNNTYSEDEDKQPFPTSGIIAQGYPVREPGYVETNVDVYLMPTSSFNANTPTYVQTTDLEDTSTPARQAGLTGMIIGSEFLACEGATLIAQNHYRVAKVYRGYGGTPIAAIASGAYWNHHGDGVFAHAISPGDIGKIIYYKILPYNFGFDLCDISSVVAQTYQVKGDYWLPSAQTPIKFFANSAAAWSANSPIIGKDIGIASGGADIILNWNAAANDEGFGFGGVGNGGAGHFLADVLTPSYRVDVMSKDGTKVSSYATNTGYFAYTLALNSADFNGFAKDLIYKVTPYNTYGDGPVSYSRSLSTFW